MLNPPLFWTDKRPSSSFTPVGSVRAWLVRWMQWCLLLAMLGGAGLALAEPVFSIPQAGAMPSIAPNGGQVTVTVNVLNNGIDASGSGNQLKVEIPAGLKNVANIQMAGAQCTLADSLITCLLPPVGAGVTLPLTFTGVANGADQTYNKLAMVVAAEGQGANASFQWKLEVTKGADLSVTAQVQGDTQVPMGKEGAYAYTVSNNGPDAAANFAVSLNVPPNGFSSVTASGTGWSCGAVVGNKVSCSYSGSLAVGASAPALVLKGTVGSTGSSSDLVSNGSVSFSESAGMGDPNGGNNQSASVSIKVLPAIDLVATIDLKSAATKTATFTTNDTGTMTLGVTNKGQLPAEGVTVSTPVPTGFEVTSMPAECGVAAGVIKCTVGPLAANSVSNTFAIGLKTGTTTVEKTQAAVATPARTSPELGDNKPGDKAWSIVNPFANLEISKSKRPVTPTEVNGKVEPVKVGDEILSTISVTNSSSSTSAAGGTITVTDLLLSPLEQYVSTEANGWTCTSNTVQVDGQPRTKLTCTYTFANGDGLAKGATLKDPLKITTKVLDLGAASWAELGNKACSVPGAAGQVPPSAADAVEKCAPATILATARQVDIGVEKTASLQTLSYQTETYTYTLKVKNNNAAGSEAVDEVVLEDDLSKFIPNGVDITKVVSIGALPSQVTCGFNEQSNKLSCTLKEMAAQETRSVVLTMKRPLKSGALSNTATVFTPHFVDSDTSNNTSSVTVTIDPRVDLEVTNIAPPAGSKLMVGVSSPMVVNIANNEADVASVVTLKIAIPAGLDVVANSIGNPSGLTCSVVGRDIECTGTMGVGPMTTALTFNVMPQPSTESQSVEFTGKITTTTNELNKLNNDGKGSAVVASPELDLTIEMKDAKGYGGDPEKYYDPVGYGEQAKWVAAISNKGKSQATGLSFSFDIKPPAALQARSIGVSAATEADLRAAGVSIASGLSVMPTPPVLACTYSGTKATCSVSQPFPANQFFGVQVVYTTSSPTMGVHLYEVTGSVAVVEKETDTANNTTFENTTIIPKTDVMIKKAVSAAKVSVNEPFFYTLTVTNKGPAEAGASLIEDTLPTGVTLVDVTKIETTVASGSTMDCTASTTTKVSCQLSNQKIGAADAATIKIPVVVKRGAVSTFPQQITNQASVGPAKVTAGGKETPSYLDLDPSNNNSTAKVEVVAASISAKVEYVEGTVADGAWKPVTDAVTIRLQGTDQWDNTIDIPLTGTTGVFTFAGLPPVKAGTGYTLTQTQPSGYFDYLEIVPAGKGTGPGASCNGTTNCAAAEAANQIQGIPLNAEENLSGFIFQELKPAAIKGWVYEDNNNNAVLETGENKIAAASTLVLTGTAYNGLPLNTDNFTGVALSAQSSGSGYSFTKLPPSNGTGYTVQQTTEPTGYLNGKTSVQPENDVHNIAGQVAAAAGIYGNTIEKIVLHSAGVATGNNFGELKPASLSGYAFIDGNKNAFRDGADTSGVTGMVVTITGTDDQGKAVSKTVKTGSSGLYEFADLRPGTYEVTITKISGMTHVGAQIGDKGGKANGVNGPSSVSGVKDATAITNITLLAGDKGLNYNFGQSGEGLSGKVYVDLNGNGVLDVGEPGIPGVTITLSGTTKDGVDVCSAISPQPCTTVTGADGGYSFVGLPESDGTGYTLTEQKQIDAPLNRYADGEETVGSLSGSKAVNDQISGIKLAGTFGSNYNFGEKGIDLPGRVFVDSNGNATPEAGEPGIPGVTITLSGNTVDGQDVCAVLASEKRSCTVQTGPDGTFNFPGLPAGNYTLTETQPKDYANSGNKPGNAGGTGSDEPSGDTKFTGIVLTPGMPKVTEYLFAEKTGGLSGYVYHDKNGSGTRDAGDPGIAGVTVSLTGTTAQGTPVTHTATTDVNGFYSFPGLLNGTYTVKETQPANWLDGKTSKGMVAGSECAACVNSTSNEIASITFTADKTYTEFNFGEVKGTSISGTVYHDVNEDRQPNPHEGLAGVTVTLTGKDDQGNPVTKNTTTGPDGKYSFPDLRPSDSNGYTITETQPADIGDFPSNGGQPGTVNGQPGGSSTQPNVITGVVLKSGESGEDYNFRDKASSLSGTVYRDDNDNGLRDSNEPGLPNVTVTLTGTSTSGASVNQTVTTDDKGNYIFVGLPAGTYQVVETQPAGMLDGRETAGTKGGNVKNDQFCDTAACNTISNIPLGQAENATGYLFGERGGSLSGTVYADLNNSGTKDADEPGLAGVQVTLSGQTQDGQDICALRGAAFCTAMTDANGNYKFEGVPPGVYQLVKSQNQVNELFSGQYGDGKETAGVLGGLVENRYFGTQTGYNSIQKISLTADGITANAGNIGGYLFGVVPSKNTQNRIPPIVSGYVYMDHSHDRVRDPMNTDGQAGWTATLVASTGQQICQVLTTAEGFYQFDNLNCPEQYRTTGLPSSADLGGATFSIFFSKDGNVLPSLTSSGDKVGEVGAGQITNLTLKNTDVLVEQNLPLDPEGVVYDAVTRKPVPGAVVGITFNGSGVFDPSKHLVGGTSFQNQTTGADGRYSFILQNDYPSGEYVLTIQSVPQAYLPGPSAMIPPCVNTLNVTMLPGGKPALMQGQRDAPGLSQTLHNPQACPVSTSGFAVDAPFAVSQQSTQYYLKFTINRGASSEILNNHIPLDPVLAGGAILVTKITPKVNVAKGDLVPYTITATNMSGGALANVRVRDMLPPGFRYRKGSATWNGLPVEPEVNGRELTWPNQSFVINEKKTYQLLLMVGAGVGEGEYVNQAWAINSQVNERISNVGSALVRVTPDPTFDCSDLIGKVFDDKNANGYQDQGEPGVPNVRVVTARGLLVTTDADGRFHVACAAIPQADRGSNFVMKLDERTLPSGYRMTTENPRDVRVTRGKMVKLNFGATVHKLVRLEVDGRAFADDGQQLSAQWNEQIAQLLTQLAERPTVLRIAYRMTGEGKDVAEQRLKALTERIQDGYAEQAQQKKQKEDDTPPLVIETESFEQNKAEGVR